jgi:hypothetical protein
MHMTGTLQRVIEAGVLPVLGVPTRRVGRGGLGRGSAGIHREPWVTLWSEPSIASLLAAAERALAMGT